MANMRRWYCDRDALCPSIQSPPTITRFLADKSGRMWTKDNGMERRHKNVWLLPNTHKRKEELARTGRVQTDDRQSISSQLKILATRFDFKIQYDIAAPLYTEPLKEKNAFLQKWELMPFKTGTWSRWCSTWIFPPQWRHWKTPVTMGPCCL